MVNVYIIPLAIIGLVVSWYIYYKKNKQEKLVCIIGDDCDRVIKSKYSTMFGIPNEILGMLFYAGVIVFSIVNYWVTTIGSVDLGTLFVIGTGFAAFFSLILLFIQAVIIKEWCEYCLVSAGVSIIIFLLAL